MAASSVFQFGEVRAEFPVPVLNERAVRAGAGILFVLAFIGFMNSWLLGDFRPTRWFVMVFVLDMSLRVLVSPRWSPSLILGQWVVRHQTPDWVGAAQKRFAWGIGLALGLVMVWLMVVTTTMGPLNLLLCGTCLLLMFFESAFGICLGCKLYTLFSRTPAQLCPGGVCDLPAEKGGPPRGAQWLVLGLSLLFALGAARWVVESATAPVRDNGLPDDSWADELPAPTGAASHAASAAPATPSAAEAERCKVPEFAKAIGHEQKWKMHNGCL
jgi:hypothetical protein